MIERVNGVEKRTAAMPQSKRRKIETEESSEQKLRFSNGGSGMLGQYVREKQQEAAQKAPCKQAVTVDLTATGTLMSNLSSVHLLSCYT